MKKNLRTFLIMLLVLVLVGGGAAALLLTQPTEETADEEESSSSQVREPLLDLEPEQVVSLQVENANSAYNLVPLSRTWGPWRTWSPTALRKGTPPR